MVSKSSGASAAARSAARSEGHAQARLGRPAVRVGRREAAVGRLLRGRGPRGRGPAPVRDLRELGPRRDGRLRRRRDLLGVVADVAAEGRPVEAEPEVDEGLGALEEDLGPRRVVAALEPRRTVSRRKKKEGGRDARSKRILCGQAQFFSRTAACFLSTRSSSRAAAKRQGVLRIAATVAAARFSRGSHPATLLTSA